MDTERLEQSACPAGTLAIEHSQVRRSFRPAASVGNLYNLVRAGEVTHISYHTCNQIHVFCKRSTVISSGGNGHVTVKKSESTGNIRHSVDSRPAHFSNQVRTHIFQILEKRDRGMGSSHVYYLPVFHYASVCHQHRSADCNYLFF